MATRRKQGQLRRHMAQPTAAVAAAAAAAARRSRRQCGAGWMVRSREGYGSPPSRGPQAAWVEAGRRASGRRTGGARRCPVRPFAAVASVSGGGRRAATVAAGVEPSPRRSAGALDPHMGPAAAVAAAAVHDDPLPALAAPDRPRPRSESHRRPRMGARRVARRRPGRRAPLGSLSVPTQRLPRPPRQRRGWAARGPLGPGRSGRHGRRPTSRGMGGALLRRRRGNGLAVAGRVPRR